MLGATSGLQLLRPRTVDHALRMLREDAGLTPIAGATDLYVSLNAGMLKPARFIDLTPLGALKQITRKDGMLVIGAAASYTQIIKSRHVRSALPMLVEASRQVGGVQIQNRGTLGGNIANGSPAGDSLPVLAAADAIVVLRSADGERRVPLTSYYTGYRTGVRKPEELIVAVEVPPVEGDQWFRKVGTRAAQAISKIVIAAVRSDRPRVAIGSVAATVVRLPKTEAVLASGDIDGAVQALEAEIRPIDDVRSTAEYRLTVAGNLLRRFWADTAR